MTAYRLFLLVAVATAVAPAAAQQPPPPAPAPSAGSQGFITLARGSLGGTASRVHRVTLDTTAAGWVIGLVILPGKDVDLDLFVYTQDPEKVPNAEPSCSSQGLGDVEQCRIVPLPKGGGPLWVKVEAVGGEGRANYFVQGQLVKGPWLEGTAFVAADARLLLPGRPSTATFGKADQPGSDPYTHVYVVSPRQSADARGWLVSATASDPAVGLTVTVFGSDGKRIAAAEEPAVSQYVSLDTSPPGRWFILVKSARRRGVRTWTYVLGAVPLGEPTPAEVIDGEFRASGDVDRDYSLTLADGRTGVIVLEGPADMRVVKGDSSVVPVAVSFGGLKQTAWLGDALANATQVLKGAEVKQPLRVSIRMRRASPGQYFGDRPQWALRVQFAVRGGTYVVRLPTQGADTWNSWWSEVPASRDGRVGDRSVGVIRLPAPPQVLSPQGAQPGPSAQQRMPAPTRFGVLARLVDAPGGAGGLNLAVCLDGGQVLDIGTSSVRWDWPAGATAVYLVAFPTPWSAAQSGGSFRVEVIQSVAAAGN